jgi:hypothetical protein
MFWLRKLLALWTQNYHVLSIYWLSTGGFVPSVFNPLLHTTQAVSAKLNIAGDNATRLDLDANVIKLD